MSSILSKSFNLCFSKFKCFPTITFSPPPAAVDEHDQDHFFSTTANNPSILKNFNSLYESNYYSDHHLSTSKSLTFSSSTGAEAATDDLFLSSSGDNSDADSVPDFTSAFASHRFFVSSPGSSNSIFEAPLEPPPHPPEKNSGAVVSGGVAVQTYSPDPYSDFKKSMVEMIEARDPTDLKADWEFLNELLLCYLTLNPKHTHKFIVGAFADVILSLVLPPPPAADNDCLKNHLRRHCATSHLSV
ncbi:transcription repressor ofp11 [Phtheirospermum japonicum]|uniref:Transcription repressor n=1 Tax=Phtheirospermum japonicum TaxID=374723 RepID=A0A830BFY2_9LAMI|nr:transcription repressor ofp11 [Phtheirospermum japonicum]